MRGAATPLSVTVNLVLDIRNALVHKQAGTVVVNLYCENNDTDASSTHDIPLHDLEIRPLFEELGQGPKARIVERLLFFDNLTPKRTSAGYLHKRINEGAELGDAFGARGAVGIEWEWCLPSQAHNSRSEGPSIGLQLLLSEDSNIKHRGKWS